jgi:hypothetical protein
MRGLTVANDSYQTTSSTRALPIPTPVYTRACLRELQTSCSFDTTNKKAADLEEELNNAHQNVEDVEKKVQAETEATRTANEQTQALRPLPARTGTSSTPTRKLPTWKKN